MIEVRELTKSFAGFKALDNITLRVKQGEMLALLGPSGCGKTTLLRVIAGLEMPDAGCVLIGGDDATGQRARDRRVGFVFQHYALFHHMSVFENVAFGLRVKPRKLRPPEHAIRERVLALLNLVQLDNLGSRLPSQLSGGQRQRVALARALAVDPKVLLLDEPFGSLDSKVRKELRFWLRGLHRKCCFTSLFVTHDQEEALELADRVLVMNHGRVEQVGTPEEIYNHPANPFVYTFLGDVNLFHCRVHNGKAQIGTLTLELVDPTQRSAKSTLVFLRPHQLTIDNHPNGGPQFRARIKAINSARPTVRLEMVTDWGEHVHAEMPHDRFALLDLRLDSEVFVSPTDPQVFTDAAPLQGLS